MAIKILRVHFSFYFILLDTIKFSDFTASGEIILHFIYNFFGTPHAIKKKLFTLSKNTTSQVRQSKIFE